MSYGPGAEPNEEIRAIWDPKKYTYQWSRRFFSAIGPQRTNNRRQDDPPSWKTIRIPSKVAVLLNKLGEKISKPRVAHKNLAIQFPTLSPGANDAKATVYCPCEFTVALHAVKNLPYLSVIGVGVFKRVRWLCQKFLESFTSHSDVLILIWEYKRECHASWWIASGTPCSVEEDMRQLVGGGIDDIREFIFRWERSGSLPSFLKKNQASPF